MSAPLHTRPFNAEHAKAGAPFCHVRGIEYEILKWDRPNIKPIVAMSKDENAYIDTFSADGLHANGHKGFVMTPLGMIDGKPVFVGDELVDKEDGHTATARPTWKEMNVDLWTWPAPAQVYPETQMTGSEFEKIYAQWPDSEGRPDLVAVANAALRHAIDSGQLVDKKTAEAAIDVAVALGNGAVEARDRAEITLKHLGYTDCGGEVWKPPIGGPLVRKEAYDECSRDLGKAERLLESLGYRSAADGEWKAPAPIGNYTLADRDMAIAEAVRDACIKKTDGIWHNEGPAAAAVKIHKRMRDDINLAAIIAGVKS